MSLQRYNTKIFGQFWPIIVNNIEKISFVFFSWNFQSINEPNFRYPGARILRLLDAFNPTPNSVFRKLLCLKMEYNEEENIQFLTNESQKVRGTTIFLAELYMQLQNVSSFASNNVIDLQFQSFLVNFLFAEW